MEEAGERNEADFEARIQQLEDEKKKIREEFNSQRAKMKELFLQKEDELAKKTKENLALADELQRLKSELDEVKSQLLVAGLTLESNIEVEKRKAEEEIASLQQLVHETVEESTSSRSLYDSEMRKLQAHIAQLQNEITELKNEKQQSPYHTVQESTSLAPSVMLSAVTKRLVKKLGADTFTSQDGMEDNMKRAQEDAEMLRSLVVPLEEEIKALKDKLRATDEQLQKCRRCGHLLEQEAQIARGLIDAPSANCITNATHDFSETPRQSEQPSPPAPCDMCSNYEEQLVKEQQRTLELEAKLAAAEKSAERQKEDLRKEIGFRKDMEEKWNEKREEHKQQVIALTRQVECAELDLKECQEKFHQTRKELKEMLHTLTKDREKVQKELLKLQKENDNLVGKYSAHSQELQSETINLPDTIEELQELLLRKNEDLIIAKIAKEEAEEQTKNLRSDIMLLKDQMTREQEEKKSLENSLVAEMDALKRQNEKIKKENRSVLAKLEKLESTDKTHQEKISDLQSQINILTGAKKQLEQQNNELRTRVSSLQQELDNSEYVQKDFVRLSQSLQVQLQKIRDMDKQVRWQYEEDVEECQSCKNPFGSSRKNKLHCRHCGQIFCPQCLSHEIPSGPNMRLSKVCDVCHTLLDKLSAPYFSEAPPPQN